MRIRIQNLTGNRIRFIGLNSLRWPSNRMIDSFRSLINFTVYQSTNDNDMWSKIGGVQDDIFVYDRCGLLAYFIPFPQSDVTHRYVEAAIMSAHFDSPCQCIPTPPSASSNCTNSTEDNRNSPVGQVSGSRQVQTPVPSDESQRQARTPHHHRPSRHSTTTTALPPECARVSVRVVCSNNTTHHQRSLTPLQQRCCHRHHHHHRTQRRPPASRCLCLAEANGGGEQGCLCRPEDGATVGRSCFCRLRESTVESDCVCEETEHQGRLCSCTLQRDHATRQCA